MMHLFALLFIGLPPGPRSGDLDLIRAVADAAEENRARFPRVSADFRLQDGACAGLDDAKAGRFTEVYEARGRYVAAEHRAFYEQIFPAAEMAATTTWASADGGSSRLLSYRATTNGKATLLETINVVRGSRDYSYGHIIKPGAASLFRDALFPLSLNYPGENRKDLGDILHKVLQNLDAIRVVAADPDALLDGVKVVYLQLRNGELASEYWVDLERGAIPLRIHTALKNGDSFDVLNSEIRSVPGHGWLPFVETNFFRGGTGLARRVLVDRADFDRPPDPKEFLITTAEPVFMVNDAANLSYLVPQRVWDLDHLPPLGPRTAVPTPKEPMTTRPAMAGPKDSSGDGFATAWSIAGALGVAILIGLIYRRSKR